jgi:putative transposase
VDRLPLLNRDRTRQWFVEALAQARDKLGFELWAYVIMPEHVHLLIRPCEPRYSMGHIEAAIKRPVSARAKAWLIEEKRLQWIERLSVKKGNTTVFRFWLPGGGYDRNLSNERPLEEVIDYIHANPVRRRLVQRASEWHWSSAAFQSGIRPVPIETDPIEL